MMGSAKANGVDLGAVTVSGICVVHCAALPLLMTLAPVAGVYWLSDHVVHWTLMALALPLSLVGLWQGFRRHASWLVPLIGALGLGLMAYDLLPEHHEHTHGLTLIGVLIVAGAHLLNIRGIRRHRQVHGCC